MGIPTIAGNGVNHKVTSPFGYDRWLVPAPTDYYRLELNKKAPASLNVARFNESRAFSLSGNQRFITKESRLPVAEVFTRKGSKDNYDLVTVTAKAGQPYVLQRFSAVRWQVIKDPGQYWISTLHSGYGEDSADSTAILTDNDYKNEIYVDSRTIEIGGSKGWKRRFNMLEELTLYIEVKQPGKYQVDADGIEGKYRFEPFATFRGKNYKTPKARRLGSAWDLDTGFYVLTVMPDNESKGVATLSVFPQGKKPEKPSLANISSRFKSVTVARQHSYKVYLNQQPGVTTGIMVRKYPIDLTNTMPISMNAGESLSLSVKIPGRGELVAQSDDGSFLKIRLRKSRSSTLIAAKSDDNRYEVKTGVYDITLRNESDAAKNYQLKFTDLSQLESTPLPQINQNLVRRPDFPELNAQQAQFFDLAKRQQKVFNVAVTEPGLYKLESTGLLETSGNIRTRVITQLDQKNANGVGRNFLIQQYLREGDYQLSLATQGETEGHLGLRLSRNSLVDGGLLQNEVPARYGLAPGEGLLYQFEVKQTGQYHLQSFGTNDYFSIRLEDADGWPLVKPGVSGNLKLELLAGTYRLVVLPTALASRVVTQVSRKKDTEERDGHGPFAIDLNQNHYKHTWLEPMEGEARQPDTWTFELPAPVETSLSISQGMEARLVSLSSDIEEIKFNDLKPLKQTLPAGTYQIRAFASRKNNRLDYWLDFALKELVVGQQRMVTAPGEIDISIGRTSLIKLSSFGRDDVKAQIYDADGHWVAGNDDRANDWNFGIIQSLPAGQYRLALSAVGKEVAQTRISLSEPKALAERTLSLPAEFIVDAPLIHSYVLDLSGEKGVFAVAAESRDSVSLNFEKSDSDGVWRSVAEASGNEAKLFAAIDNDGSENPKYRLKVWSSEQRGASIKVSSRMLNTPEYGESEIASGFKLPTQVLLNNQLSAVKVKLNSPGLFKPASEGLLFWVSRPDTQLNTREGLIGSGESKSLWLVFQNLTESVKATRVLVQDETLAFNVKSEAPVWVDSSGSKKSDDLFVAESRIGLPGVGVSLEGRVDGRYMGVGNNSSVALATSGSDVRLKLWNAEAKNPELPVRLTRYQFKKTTPTKLLAGTHDAQLLKQSAISFSLQGKMQYIQFNLPSGTAAFMYKSGKVLRSFWSDQGDLSYQVLSDADQLSLFNTTLHDRVLVLNIADSEAPRELTGKKLYKRHFAQAGIFSLALSQDVTSNRFLESYGNNVSILTQNQQGQVDRGERVQVSGDSLVNISHGVGLLSVWVNDSQPYLGDIVGSEATPPTVLNLKGQSQTINFERESAGFISLQSTTPLIIRIRRDGLTDQVQIFEHGLKKALFFPAGKNQLQFESTTSQDLKGALRIDKIVEGELKEGLGTKVSLLPGESRLYVVTLPKKQDVGIGVQASVDIARATLFNQRGEQLGFGVTQKHNLGQGTYYLMLELPSNADQSVELRPAIVGLEIRDTGASKETMLDYQQYSSPEAL